MKKFINSNRWALMLFLALGLMMSGCTKEEPECTDCLGTFRCKINGESWKPNCDSGTIIWGCSAIDCQYYKDSRALEIRVVNKDDNSRLLINGRDVVLGENQVYNTDREYKDNSRGNCANYDLIQAMPNYIELMVLDTVNHIVEGTFSFSVLGECDQDTLHITDGYFHLGYRF